MVSVTGLPQSLMNLEKGPKMIIIGETPFVLQARGYAPM